MRLRTTSRARRAPVPDLYPPPKGAAGSPPARQPCPHPRAPVAGVRQGLRAQRCPGELAPPPAPPAPLTNDLAAPGPPPSPGWPPLPAMPAPPVGPFPFVARLVAVRATARRREPVRPRSRPSLPEPPPPAFAGPGAITALANSRGEPGSAARLRSASGRRPT